MRMWHQAHWAAWGRHDLLDRSNRYYFSVLEEAESYARMQGFDGARWYLLRQTFLLILSPSESTDLFCGAGSR